jgi:hypothetical protein
MYLYPKGSLQTEALRLLYMASFELRVRVINEEGFILRFLRNPTRDLQESYPMNKYLEFERG